MFGDQINSSDKLQLTLDRVLEAQALRSPERTAVVVEQQRLTYRELNERAEHLAAHLQSLGAGPESIVALFTERSLDMIVGILAILRAGAGYLPIDPEWPTERTRFLLQDA